MNRTLARSAARGTLWSEAGNSLDEASLGVALFRASGIPARYAHGTLSDANGQALILTMFPEPTQVVGYLAPGTDVADPAHDPTLLAETRNHYWLQIDVGSGFQNADTSGLPGSGIGTAFTATSDTFTEVADALRHKVHLSLEAETYSQAVAAFNGSTGLTMATVLDKTWNAVELVGKPISVSQFVNEVNQGGAAFSSRALTYTPYFRLGDAADSLGAHDDLTTGTPFQELLTNFPLGSTILTGLTLNMDLTLPGGGSEHYERAMVDRIGYAARQNSTAATFSVDANGRAALSAADNTTVSVLSSQSSPGEPVGLQSRVRQLEESLRPFAGVSIAQLPADYGSRLSDFVLHATRLLARIQSQEADDMSRSIARWERVAAYEDRPRLVITLGRVEPGTATAPGSVEFTIDLRRDSMRSVVAPGQTVVASAAYQFTRGLLATEIERQILAAITPATQRSSLSNTNTVLQNARDQQISVLTLFPADASNLDNLLTASSDAVIRIAEALSARRIVIVPAHPVAQALPPRPRRQPGMKSTR